MTQDFMKRIGKGTTWVLEVDDHQEKHEELISRGVKFAGPATQKPYDMEAVFEDLHGNPWVLLQPK
jgi:hypothetical protein